MSRIGKKTITVPAGVKVAIKDSTVAMRRAQGQAFIQVPPGDPGDLAESEKSIQVTTDANLPEGADVAKFWGTTRALINNMITGVTKGYEKTMEIVGVGWVPTLQGKKLKLQVGFANAILLDIPVGLTVTVDKTFVKIGGPDKQMVGQFATSMRAVRKPEPYNGKGIKYLEEVIKRKQGKAFSTEWMVRWVGTDFWLVFSFG